MPNSRALKTACLAPLSGTYKNVAGLELHIFGLAIQHFLQIDCDFVLLSLGDPCG